LNVLATSSLTRRFGAKVAVDAVSIAVEAGESFALLGSNGAGKTTLIKMLTTLLPPTSGSASVAGFDVVRQSAKVRRAIGYVPQAISADGTLTGAENLRLFARLYDVPRRAQAATVQAALTFMGLQEVGDRLVNMYSGGMVRRLEIAQAMLHRPQVLFLDEPTTGLDPIARTTVWEHVSRLRSEAGMTVFFTTHLMEEADRWCTRLAIMNAGRVVITGTPIDLKQSLGIAAASLNDVFTRYAGTTIQNGERYGDILQSRAVARRLG
jgi:ABC-2 type transport system ATP-binding protein